jgi:hypothetical protein
MKLRRRKRAGSAIALNAVASCSAAPFPNRRCITGAQHADKSGTDLFIKRY